MSSSTPLLNNFICLQGQYIRTSSIIGFKFTISDYIGSIWDVEITTTNNGIFKGKCTSDEKIDLIAAIDY